jgi:hypothetical protein
MRIQPRSSAQRLVLREGALEWLAKDKRDWRRSDGTPNRARIAEAAGLQKQALNRVANGAYPAAETVAALIRLGARQHNVTDSYAFSRICLVADHVDQLDSATEAVAA